MNATRVFKWTCERCGVENRSSSNLCRQCNFVRVKPTKAFLRKGPAMKRERGRPLGVIPITCMKCGKQPPGNHDLDNTWILRTLTDTLLDQILEEDLELWPELKKPIEELRPYVGMQVCPDCRPLGIGHYHMIMNLDREPIDPEEGKEFQESVKDLKESVDEVMKQYPLCTPAAILRIARTRNKAMTPQLHAQEIRDEYPDLTEDEIVKLIHNLDRARKDDFFKYEKMDVRVQRLIREARPVKFSLMKKNLMGDDILSAIEDIEHRIHKGDPGKKIRPSWLWARYEVNRDRYRRFRETERTLKETHAENRRKHRECLKADKAIRDRVNAAYQEWERRRVEMKKSISLTNDPDVQRKIREWAYQAEAEYSKVMMEANSAGFAESKMLRNRAVRSARELRRIRAQAIEWYTGATHTAKLIRKYRHLLYELRHVHEIIWSKIKDDLPVEWKIMGNGSRIPENFLYSIYWNESLERYFHRLIDTVLQNHEIDPQKEGWRWNPNGLEIGYLDGGDLVAGMRQQNHVMILPWEPRCAFEGHTHWIGTPHEREEEEVVAGAHDTPEIMPRWAPTDPMDLRDPDEELGLYIKRKKPVNLPIVVVCSECGKKIKRTPGSTDNPKPRLLPVPRISYDESKDPDHKNPKASPCDTVLLCEKCYQKKRAKWIAEGPIFKKAEVIIPGEEREKGPNELEVKFRKNVSKAFVEARKMIGANYKVSHVTPILRYSKETLEHELWMLIIPKDDEEKMVEKLVYRNKYVINVMTANTVNWKSKFLWLWIWKDRSKWVSAAKKKGYEFGPDGLIRGAFRTTDPEEIARRLDIRLPGINETLEPIDSHNSKGKPYQEKMRVTIMPKEYWRGIYKIYGANALTWDQMCEHLEPGDPHYAEAKEYKERVEREEADEAARTKQAAIDQLTKWQEEREKKKHERKPDKKKMGYELTMGMIGYYKGVDGKKVKETLDAETEDKLYQSESNRGCTAAVNLRSFLNETLPFYRRIDDATYQEWLEAWLDPSTRGRILRAKEAAEQKGDKSRPPYLEAIDKAENVDQRGIAVEALRVYDSETRLKVWDTVVTMAGTDFLKFVRAKGWVVTDENYDKWHKKWLADELKDLKKQGPAHPK